MLVFESGFEVYSRWVPLDDVQFFFGMFTLNGGDCLLIGRDMISQGQKAIKREM